MKRHTTPSRRHSRQSVLEVRVMSPRIVWFGFLRFTGKLTKIACLLGLLAALGWGGWRGIQRAFVQNPDFRLRVIALNANPVIDELGVAAAAGINLESNPSLFTINVQDVIRKLKNLPAIADAHVERHLPGTLEVSVIPRTPVAWLSCPGAGLTETRHSGNLLVDHAGVAYPCPERQVESCAMLPVIELSTAGDCPVKAGETIRLPEVEHCSELLDAACAADPDAMQWIESVKQVNEWSLRLVTRQGTTATFGLGDHSRQIESLRAALDHAGEKGYLIDTINLIPKYNIPITLRTEHAPPRTAPAAPAAHQAESAAMPVAPVARQAEPADARATPAARQHTESAAPRATPVARHSESPEPRATPATRHADSAPPRATPVKRHADSAPPRAIPVVAQTESHGRDARRTRDASNKHN